MNIEEYAKLFKEYPSPVAQPLWVKDYQYMITHTRGQFREGLLSDRRPNEPENILDFRLKNMRDITRYLFTNMITNIQRALAPSSIEVVYPDEVSEYLSSNNFDDSDLIGYIRGKVTKFMCEMANGLLVWWPEDIGDVTRHVTMRPIIVNPADIVHYDSDVLTFLSAEKSEVVYNKKVQKIGDVYYVILKDKLYKRVQVGNKTDNEYEFIEHYINPTGSIYALVLGGDATSGKVCITKTSFKNAPELEIEYYTSFISGVVPVADECLCRFSDNQGTNIRISYPITETATIECSDCKGGRSHGKEKCESCNGTGRIALVSGPYGNINRPLKTNEPGNEQESDIPAQRYLHPDVAILEHGEKGWQTLYEMVKDGLYQLYSEQAQSGYAKEFDREDKLAFLDKVANHVYNYLLRNSVQIIYKFWFPSREWPEVTINLPATFTPKTTADLTAEIKSLKDQNAPDILIAEKTRELMYKSFSGDPRRMRMYDIYTQIDPLYLRTPREKADLLALDAITNEDIKRSAIAISVISQYANDTRDFMIKDYDSIINEVNQLISLKLASNGNTAGQ